VRTAIGVDHWPFIVVATVWMAASGVVFASSASGRMPIDRFTTRPSKLSIDGDTYI
jgi:hypothetical protein